MGILKKILKNKWFWIPAAIVVIGVGIVVVIFRGPKIEYVTERVTKGTLTQTVSATGAVESLSNVDLSFAVTGEISEIFVKEGDRVGLVSRIYPARAAAKLDPIAALRKE